jgi:prepilin-type N-terminal cleavage/methylation domain-containing protein
MHPRGFTLVELLVVMTISAILIAAAVPSFVWFMATSRTSDSTNTLLAGLQLARSEAIRRNMVVVVCRSLNPFEPAPFLPASSARTLQVHLRRTTGDRAGSCLRRPALPIRRTR